MRKAKRMRAVWGCIYWQRSVFSAVQCNVRVPSSNFRYTHIGKNNGFEGECAEHDRQHRTCCQLLMLHLGYWQARKHPTLRKLYKDRTKVLWTRPKGGRPFP